MNPVRLIVIGLVIWLAILLFRRVMRALPTPSERKEKTAPTDKGGKDYQRMVRCHYCELHIPKASALARDDRYYCSEEHYRLAQDGS